MPARKQEQEPASTEVTEVAPSVLRAQLPIAFTGLGHVNMYCLVDERGVAVVDAGLPGPSCWRAIEDRLRKAGFRVRDVHTVIVTHSHPDHFGGAGRLAAEAGADLLVHAAFSVPWLPETAADVESIDDEVGTEPDRAAPRRTPWAPKRFQPPLRDRLRVRGVRLIGRRFFAAPVPTRRVRDGEVVKLAGREWTAIHTPGHTADHLCLHDPEEGLVLVGDHVLPSITPHVGGAGAGPDPLERYVAALSRVAELPHVKLALPAHGHPFAELPSRVEAIRRHHDRRLAELERIVAATGPATVSELSRELFPRRHWGLMAESETYAHLEHLRLKGRVIAWRNDRGELVYRLEA